MESRRVVITGVTKGLGRALAKGFAKAGHTVIGCGRAEGDVLSLRAELGAPHEIVRLDVTIDEDVKKWADDAIARLGAPDLLINNAAIINSNANLWEISAADFNKLTDVNINGVANVIRRFAPAMIARRSGVIVNMSSGWGRSTAPEVAPYCASKFAIEGLTKALAQELPKGMAAIPVNPGIIDTQMLRSCFGAGAKSYDPPAKWAESAVPTLLKLGPADNGRSVSIS